MEIGILGGTGPAGRAIAARLASVGFDVILGSRNRYRAMEACDGLLGKWPDHGLAIRSGDNASAAAAPVVVVATPWDAAAATASSVADHLDGTVIVCMSNAIARVAGEFQPLVPPRGSVAASVQAEIPDAYVAAAFHHVPATELGNLNHEIVSDIPHLLRSRNCHRNRFENRLPVPRFQATRCGWPLQCDGDRGVHCGAVAAQQPLPHQGGGGPNRHRGFLSGPGKACRWHPGPWRR